MIWKFYHAYTLRVKSQKGENTFISWKREKKELKSSFVELCWEKLQYFGLVLLSA